MLVEGRNLRSDRSRVAFIRQQQVEDGRRIGAENIPRTVCHCTVGNLEKSRQPNVLFVTWLGYRMLNDVAKIGGALETASQLEKSPSIVARHAVHRLTAERQQQQQQVVERCEPVVRLRRICFPAR